MRELKMQPGRAVGELLELIREEQAEGHIATREEALDFARAWLVKPNSNKIQNLHHQVSQSNTKEHEEEP